jgi:acetyltransferase-like isoleucine patch superfamily enzyme
VEINRGFEVYPGLLLRNSRIVIEDDVVIGPNVCLFGAGQKFSSEDLIDVSGDIVIRKGAYIGANTVIRYGVEIGERSIVGAGSVVVKDVKELDVVAGNPARSLRE